MKRWPVIPTILVTLAIAAMIGLGLWQLVIRRPQKLAFLAQLEANPAKPAIAFPRFPDDSLLFRRTSGSCLQPVAKHLAGAGSLGYRMIVTCRAGAEGPGMIVQLGTTRDPNARLTWRGGEVSGYISHAPDSRPLIATLFDHHVQQLMIVAGTPPVGFKANPPADLSAVPNNHLAYGVQWFIFAGIAGVIYVLALRRRSPPLPPSL